MRAEEFIVEAVSRADDIDHLRKRVHAVVQLLKPIGDHPLVYREFKHNIGAETAVLKVSNDRKEFKARSGSNPKQSALLQALGITNPVFCTMQTPGATQGFFGGANIFVPGADYGIVWSPVVKDLGGNDVVGSDSDRYGHRDLGGGVSQGPTPDRQVGAEFANTYRSGWPPGYTDNELIFDCGSYYLLNIKDFLRRFAGRQNRDIVNHRTRINQEVFNAKFSTYGDIVWYLSNTLPKYLDWYEANVVANQIRPKELNEEEFLIEYRDDDDDQTAHRDGLDLESIQVGSDFQVTASCHDRQLARVIFKKSGDTLVPRDLSVEERYRGQGIAAVMYDWVKDLGYKIQRSPDQSQAGQAFWDKNRGEEGRVWEAEERLLDPEEYGLELPIATVRRIVTAVMAQVDPQAVVKVKGSPEGYYLVSTDNEMLTFDFGITADGGEISANIVNGYSSYKGAGVVTKIIDQCFKAMVKKYGRPTKFVISTQQDRGYGVWQAIAQKLGAEWGGSMMENFADGKGPGERNGHEISVRRAPA